MLCSSVRLCVQVLNDIQKEYEVTKNIHDMLNSFKANPIREAQKHRVAAEDKPSEAAGAGGRDPDVWPPPTPVESRCVCVCVCVCVCAVYYYHASSLCAVHPVAHQLEMHPSHSLSNLQRGSPSKSLQILLLEEVHGTGIGGK